MRLLERDADLAALAGQWDRARGGRGGMVVVTGESGAGKSTLLQAFTDDLPDAVPVLWGACDPLLNPRPLGPIHDVADQLDEDARASLHSAVQPHEIFEAVFAHLRRHPSVLVVDDLHWADQGTIDLLRYLLRRIRATSSLLVGAVRDDEVGATHPLRSFLGDVARSSDATSTALDPLSVDAIVTLVEDRPLDAGWLHHITSGNPFYVVEMLDHAGEEIPGTVRDAVLARTVGLDADAWDLLHLLACAPGVVDDHLLANLGVGLDACRAVNDAGLVQRGARGVGFRHDLCRIAISGTVPPGGEVALHRRMLDALDASPNADPAVLTHHAIGAGDVARTVVHAVEAGRASARSGAHTEAAAFFEIALEQNAALHASDEAEVLELLAEECYLLDRLADAIHASERAMALRERVGDAEGVSRNHHALAVYHWYNADRDLAVSHAAAAVSVLDGDPAERSDAGRSRLAHGFAVQSYLSLQASDLDGTRSLASRAAEVAETIDEPMLAVRVQLLEAIGDLLAGEPVGRETTVAILAEGHEQFDEIYSGGYSNLSYLDVEQRRFSDAAKVLGYSLPMTIERDLPICRVWQLGSRGRMKLMEGRWDEAVEDADAVLSWPSAPLARTWPHLVRGLVALRRGADADDDLDQAWRLARRFGEPLRVLPAATALAERVWLTGESDDRVDEGRALLADAHGAGLEWARGDLATWLCRLDGDDAAGFSMDAGLLAEPYRSQLTGDPVAAAAAWAALSAPYDQALALIDSGDPDHARTGLDLLDRLGANRVAAKVRQDLRSRGMTQVPARRRSTTLQNPAGLTSRQVEILRLLGDGSTNAEIAERLFISTKTVDHHVSALLSKLQVAGRREAVRRGTELGLIA